jgi:hypothetical protein
MITKTTVPQSVFDSKDAKRIMRAAFAQADKELFEEHKRGIFSEGNPNHPMYRNGINYTTGLPVNIFGYDTKEFLAKQYK